MTLATSPHAQNYMQIFHIYLCVIYRKVPSSSREPGIIVESFSYQTSIQILNKRLIFLYVAVCGALGDQRGVSELLGLELQLVASCPACVLGTKLGSSERETGHLDP